MSKIEVKLLDHMGSDLTVVNAARVSFDKASKWEQKPCFGCADLTECDCGPVLSEKDQKLIKYLAKNGHWSPFAHAFLSYRIKAPIFVARQLVKHQVGLAWNEVSRRYVDSPPEFFEPEEGGWRKRAENVKQGSAEDRVWTYDTIYNGCKVTTLPEAEIQEIHAACLKVYQEMLEGGVCPEQARMVLPQSTMTEWIWSGSLYAFARVCKLRLDPHAQKETREVAEYIAEEAYNQFPHSWNALMTQENV